MQYRSLGRTGLLVSEIGHGLWGIADWSGSDPAAVRESLQASLDNGCNLYDTAFAYGKGASDKLLGELIRANPGAELIVAAKIPPKNWTWPASSRESYDDVYPPNHVREMTRRMRSLLGVDSIDVLQFHVWDDTWAAAPAWSRVITELKREGQIKHFGLSLNRWEPWNGLRAIKTGEVDVIQVIYNVFDQAPEDELLPACKEFDVGVIARVPLDEGSLGGKLTPQTRFPPEDWRSRYFGPENLMPTIERVRALQKVLPIGMKLPELALRFVLQNRAVSSTIVGMRDVEHVTANMGASDGVLLEQTLLSTLRAHRWDRKVTAWAN